MSCDLCTFSEPSDINKYFNHLKTHLKNREVVKCPFAGCFFKSSVLSTFTAHRSRNHKSSTLENFRPELLARYTLSVPVIEEDFVLDTEDILHLILHLRLNLNLKMERPFKSVGISISPHANTFTCFKFSSTGNN